MSEFLTREQERELVLLHKATKDRKRGDRIKAILLLNRGYEYEEAARILLISERTIQNWEQLFRSGGIEGLLENRCIGTTPKLSSEQREALDHQLQERIYLTAKEVCVWVRKRYGVGYGVAGMQKLLKRMGYWYKKPKVVPGKANKEKQEQYLQAYRRLSRKKRKADRVYFMEKKVLYNQYYETFAEFREKTLEFFKNFDRYKPEAALLLTDNFQVIGN